MKKQAIIASLLLIGTYAHTYSVFLQILDEKANEYEVEVDEGATVAQTKKELKEKHGIEVDILKANNTKLPDEATLVGPPFYRAGAMRFRLTLEKKEKEKVFLQIYETKEYEVEVDEGATVAQVKQALEQQHGIKVNTLKANNVELPDKSILVGPPLYRFGAMYPTLTLEQN